MDAETEARLIRRFVRMFGCDTARISKPRGKLFLIIGHNRNTRDDAGRWFKNGEPIHFDYVKEKVIASGDTPDELMESAKEYKRLLRMSRADYFRAVCPS
jgi:hypothetical protein